MKTNIYILIFAVFFSGKLLSQTDSLRDTSTYNNAYWNALAKKHHYSQKERAEFIKSARQKVDEETHSHQAQDAGLVWITEPPTKGYSQNSTFAGPCTNIDFETGTLSGWIRSTGYNSLTPVNISGGIGCCPNPNGDQTIMGGGTDPYGNFPRVYPGSGAFSLRLGSTATGGIADRVQQTFFVTPQNANFTYRYAVVLNDGGHTITEQPRFTSEIIDSVGIPVPCTFYNVSAGANIGGFFTSTLLVGTGQNTTPVIYKPWTDVAVDLTPNIGQNVTLRFTVYDCGPSGHFAYAYIDGFCSNFATSVADTTCPNVPYSMCGPNGFLTYRWDGPGVVNNPSQCINVSAPGVYTCQTVLVPGCPGPTFTHTLTNFASPILTFTPSTGVCSNQYSFASTSSISVGSIVSYSYTFGDNTSTFLQSPVHNYPGPGSYTVTFKATSNRGCKDSTKHTVFVYPNPLLTFSPPSHCMNTLVQFTNSSNVPPLPGVPPGTVTSYSWNLGNGATSTITNPTSTYTNSGTYTITLSAISNMSCISTISQTLGIFPHPILDFTANPLCDINGTSFSPSTSTAIASGSIAGFFWNFGDGGTSTAPNPLHIYTAPGTYTISFIGTSNHSCVDTVTKILTISPTPTVSFNTFSVNACTPSFSFVNTSTVAAGSISYTWNFGGNNTTTVASPQYTFPSIGNYTVRLIGMSNMGCPDTASLPVTIYPLPVVSVSVPASCESAIFTVSTTAVSGSVTSYSWNFGDPPSGPANTSTLQNPTHSYINVGNYVLSLLIMSNQNCPSTYSSQILVHPNPVTSFTAFPPDACINTFTFMNNSGFSGNPPQPGNSIVSSLWNFAGINTSTVTAPVYTFPGPGIYTVSLLSTTNFNCTATNIKTITIHPYPQASLSVAPACLNVAAVYSGTSSIPPPGAIVSYTWNFGDGAFDNNPSSTHNYITSGTYSISYSVQSDQGCVTTRTTNLVIYGLPSINFNFINPCVGSPLTFSNSSTPPPGNSITGYKWDFEDDGLTNSTQTNPLYTYTVPGQYQVELFVKTNFNCVDSLKKSITVHDTPKPAISVENVCFGNPSPFSASLSLPGLGNTITGYNWNFGDGSPAGSSPTGTHLYAGPGVYTLQLTATNNVNCSASAVTVAVVHQVPIVNFSANAACLGSATNFTNFSSIGPPDQLVKWRWDFGNGFVQSLAQDTSKIFSSTGSYVIQLEATSNKQCTTTKSNTIVVHSNPQAEFTNSVVCVGDNIAFRNFSSTGDGTIISNSWDFNGDNISDQDAVTPKFVYPAFGANQVTLRVTTNFGCSHTKTKLIFANPKAVAAFTSDVRSGCPELCVNFKNLSAIVSGSFSSTWIFGDGSLPTFSSDPQHCFSEGNYNTTLQLRSDSGCVSSLVNTGFIQVFPLPLAAFNVDPPEVDEDDPTIKVFNQSSSDASFIKYYISDGSSFGTPDFTHAIKNLSKKMKPMIVQIVGNNFGCVDTLYKVLDIKPAFAIYVPNVFTPNTDGNNDRFQAKGVGILKFAMQIYDRWGHLVWQTNDIYDSWDGNMNGEIEPDPIKDDVYTWKAQVIDILNKTHILVGHVTVVK